MVWTTYKEKVKRLSARLIEVQKPIRILDAIKWDPSIDFELRNSNFKEIPKISSEYYRKVELGFDPEERLRELKELTRQIDVELGGDPLAELLKVTADQYVTVIEMLRVRGTKAFWEYSRKLYGSPKDRVFGGQGTILELGQVIYSILTKMDDIELGQEYPATIDAASCVAILNERFLRYFSDDSIGARLSDGLTADAGASSDFVKINQGRMFSSRDVDILEVHEGWVHVGTTQNGQRQHVAKWLSKGPPRCTATQEGLAILLETLTFRAYPRRLRRLNDRVLGIAKAEDGANLVELIEFYRTEGYSEEECLAFVKRIYRGGLVEGGAPFTKDISYCRGFIEIHNFLRAAIHGGRPELIPFLFAGKLHVEDVPLLYQKYKEGIVDPPRYLPEQFQDVSGLTVLMAFASVLNLVDFKHVQEHYDKLFREYT